MNILVPTLAELDSVVDAILDLMEKGYRLFLLSGDLGSGKTTLVQALCKRLDVKDGVSSPTFSLVNAYFSPTAGTVYHMDLYRLEKTSDLLQIGLEEYLASGQLCLIEWPDVGTTYFFPPYVRVSIEADTDNIRNFRITTYDKVDA